MNLEEITKNNYSGKWKHRTESRDGMSLHQFVLFSYCKAGSFDV